MLYKRRGKRNSDATTGAQDTLGDLYEETCTDAGTESEFDSDYLHLCSLCSAKRLLPEDQYYPRVINEVYCRANNAGCLAGNGKCVDTIFNVHILKKRDGVCRLCVREDEPLAIDDWVLVQEQIRVGCECMLDKDSVYKSYWFSSETTSTTSDIYSGLDGLDTIG